MKPSVGHIIDATAQHYGIGASVIKSLQRGSEITLIRHRAMWAAQQLTQQSLPLIGRVFGRDHTTVLYAIQKIHLEREENPKPTDELLGFIQSYLLSKQITNYDPQKMEQRIQDILVTPAEELSVSAKEVKLLAFAALTHIENKDQKLENETNADLELYNIAAAWETLQTNRYSDAERAARISLEKKLAQISEQYSVQ